MPNRFRFRIRPRFGLRAMLAALLIFSVPLGWLAGGMHRARRQWDAARGMERLGGAVYYGYQLTPEGGLIDLRPSLSAPGLGPFSVMRSGGPQLPAPAPQGDWRRRLLGDDFFDRVERVDLSHCNFHGRELAPLVSLPHLRVLNLGHSNVTDEDLAILEDLPRLEALGLTYAEITDAGVRHVAKAKTLRRLSLSMTYVTDAGLRELESLPNLEQLHLHGTETTEAGIAHFQRALPECEILNARHIRTLR